MAYTERQRAMAVEIARRNNSVLDEATMSAIRKATKLRNLPAQTVRVWLKGMHQAAAQKPALKAKSGTKKTPLEMLSNPDEVEAIATKFSQALDEKLEVAAHKFVDAAVQDGKINDAGSRELMTAAGIAIDKMRILRGLPTEIVAILPDLVAELERGGVSAAAVFHTLLEKARAANAGR